MSIKQFIRDCGRNLRHHSASLFPLQSILTVQILNLLATLNENPHIRYYNPQHHSPLGPLANQSPSASPGAGGGLPIPPANAQGGSSLRWRSAMGDGNGPSSGGGRGPAQPQMEYTSRRLAMQVQADLDEYLANNPDFPVGLSPLIWGGYEHEARQLVERTRDVEASSIFRPSSPWPRQAAANPARTGCNRAYS